MSKEIIAFIIVAIIEFIAGCFCGYNYANWENLQSILKMNKTDEEMRLRRKENEI